MAAQIKVSRDGALGRIAFSNPPLHTICGSQVGQLNEVLDDFGMDERVRVILFIGEGEGVFIRHYDVGELASVSGANAPRSFGQDGELHAVNKLLLRLGGMDKICIAAMNGTATGGGLEFALACDLRFATDDPAALFGFPEVGLGIPPGAGGTQRAASLIGMARTLELVLTGRLLDPQEALRLGLVHGLVPAAGFEERVADFARQLAQRPPQALAAAKKAVREGQRMALRDGLAQEQQLFFQCLASPDTARLMRKYADGGQDIANHQGLPLP